MSKFGNCVACDTRFHYSETSELTVAYDMNGGAYAHFWAPDVCISCEALIQNA